MVEVLCGVLAGAGVRARRRRALQRAASERQDTGHFHLAIDPERTVGRDAFAACSAGCSASCARSRRPPGFDEVLVAGRSRRTARAPQRERDGVPIEPALWATLCALSDELGVSRSGGRA